MAHTFQNIRRCIVIALCLGLALVPARSAEAGKYAGEFLQVAVGARPLGLGGAYCSLTQEGWAPFWNPAGSAHQRRLELSVQHATLFNLAEHEYINLALPLPSDATLGFSWIRLSVDDIPVFPEPGRFSGGELRPIEEWVVDPVKFFNDAEDAFIFTFAKMNHFDLDLGWQYFVLPMRIPLGLNLKYIRQSLGDATASGMGIDLGAQIGFGLDKLFDFEPLGYFVGGLNLQNIGKTALSWDTSAKHRDHIPFNVKFGFSYAQPFSARGTKATIAYDRDTAYQGQNHFGLEMAYRDRLALRLGLEGEKLAVGAGFRFWRLVLDYAFVSYDLGNIHRVSGSVGF
ncbi:MAG: hypothetical protein AMJ92_04050 [candidate division Zixibacteria bacterium SM23_81]|nr:MAG: hypothetical protein AMJ92_04050 [candidate division Zixibacteria bacterium SM23_81]